MSTRVTTFSIQYLSVIYSPLNAHSFTLLSKAALSLLLLLLLKFRQFYFPQQSTDLHKTMYRRYATAHSCSVSKDKAL